MRISYKTKRPWIIPSAVIFCFLYLNCSMYAVEVFSTPVKVAGSFTLILILLISKRHVVLTQKRNINYLLLCAGALCVLSVISMLLNTPYLNNDIPTLISLSEAVCLCLILRKDEFETAYINAAVAASIIALVSFALLLVAPGVLQIFPLRLWHTTIFFRDLGLAAVADSQYLRNNGMFYEPGQMAFYLNLAIAFWFMRRGKEKKWKVVLICVATISTLSTAGLICTILLVLGYSASEDNLGKLGFRYFKTTKIIFICILIVGGFFAFYLIAPANFDYFIRKFSEIDFSDASITEGTGSGFERWRAVLIGLNAMAANPVFGIGGMGIGQYGLQNMIATVAFLNWFGLYGLAYGLICCSAYFSFYLSSVKGALSKFLVFFGVFAMLGTQAVEGDIFVFVQILFSAELVVPYILGIASDRKCLA